MCKLPTNLKSYSRVASTFLGATQYSRPSPPSVRCQPDEHSGAPPRIPTWVLFVRADSRWKFGTESLTLSVFPLSLSSHLPVSPTLLDWDTEKIDLSCSGGFSASLWVCHLPFSQCNPNFFSLYKPLFYLFIALSWLSSFFFLLACRVQSSAENMVVLLARCDFLTGAIELWRSWSRVFGVMNRDFDNVWVHFCLMRRLSSFSLKSVVFWSVYFGKALCTS